MDIKEEEIQRRIMRAMNKPFSYKKMVSRRDGEAHHFRIADGNDDPIARTNEECYAKFIVDALNKADLPRGG